MKFATVQYNIVVIKHCAIDKRNDYGRYSYLLRKIFRKNCIPIFFHESYLIYYLYLHVHIDNEWWIEYRTSVSLKSCLAHCVKQSFRVWLGVELLCQPTVGCQTLHMLLSTPPSKRWCANNHKLPYGGEAHYTFLFSPFSYFLLVEPSNRLSWQ